MTLLDELLGSVGAYAASGNAERNAILHRITPAPELQDTWSDRSLVRTADLLEASALAAAPEEQVAAYSKAFACWTQIESTSEGLVDMYDHGYVPSPIALAFHIAVSGVLARRPSETQHALVRALPQASTLASTSDLPDANWRTVLLTDVMLASILLVRKADGWADVRLALQLMQGLRDKQSQLEAEYLLDAESVRPEAAERQVFELLACYHLAQVVTTTGAYIQAGTGGSARVVAQLGRHRDQALDAATHIRDGVLVRVIRLATALCSEMINSSIWTQLSAMGARLSGFAAELASADIEKPLLELWPSQQEALRSNFLDTYSRATLVEMPTSAGKTLLAKISIVQTLALNPESTVAYVVPTRVLVNQVVDELRRDFRPLGYDVEQAVPVFELDPTENLMLSNPPKVLVTTAEKLDLLLRENHPAVANLSQIVVDEAHNLSDGLRGARLELLLATIKRDRPDARFLLMSPFLPQAQQLVDWLGDGRGLDPIEVHWRPNRRLVVAIESERRRNRDYALVLRAVEASSNEHVAPGTEIELERTESRITSLEALSLRTTKAIRHRGGVTLVLCMGKPTAMHRAEAIASDLPERESTPLLEAVLAHLTDELGASNPLGPLLRRGVAYHHAGVSLESRKLVERLIQDGLIHTVCGTTTLAQGVNFPINNVIIETLRKGRESMSHADFWNTAGRAGRGRLSDLGLVAFPVATNDQRERWKTFLQGEAEAVASQLAGLVQAADSLGDEFNFRALYQYETLSPFLQYLAHAMKVSGAGQAALDIEDLLRNSLVYQQAQEISAESAARLAALCRRYLRQMAQKPGLVALADGTGFSTTSIEALRVRAGQDPSISNLDNWAPDRLFGSDHSALTARIGLLADLPELKFGSDASGPFSPERVARILTDWVNGVPMETMIERHGAPDSAGYQKSSEFASYLYSSLTNNASWGMGALQRVSWASQTGEPPTDGAHIPSMLFFGVRTKEAIWMRMAGLPRDAATRISGLWSERMSGQPESYAQLRGFISSISTDQWEQRRGASAVSGEQMSMLWSVLG